MKKIIYKLLTFVLFVSSAYPQQKDSLIQLYPGLGDTLEFFDCDSFNCFKNRWISICILIIRDEQLFQDYNCIFQKDTIFIQSLTIVKTD